MINAWIGGSDLGLVLPARWDVSCSWEIWGRAVGGGLVVIKTLPPHLILTLAFRLGMGNAERAAMKDLFLHGEDLPCSKCQKHPGWEHCSWKHIKKKRTLGSEKCYTGKKQDNEIEGPMGSILHWMM